MQPTIRSLLQTDLPLLQEALRDIVAELSSTAFPPPVADRLLAFYTAAEIRRRAFGRSSNALGAFEESSLMGFAWGWESPQGVFTVDWIAILPQARGRGMGKALLQNIQNHARAAAMHKAALFVSAGNASALAFYVHEGYSIEGYHPSFAFGGDFYSLGKLLGAPAPRGASAQLT